MKRPILILPDLEDETVVKLHDFLYEVLDVFEAHYSYQMLRHERNMRHQRPQHAFLELKDDEVPF